MRRIVNLALLLGVLAAPAAAQNDKRSGSAS